MVRAVFPGTFDPVHYGHVDIARRAARLFDEVVIAVFDRPLKNLLFSPEERIQLVRDAFRDDPKIRITGYNSLTVHFCRSIDAQVIVRGLRVFSDFEFEFRMALANNRLAPDIEVVALITNEEHTFLSSTTVREIASMGGDVSSMVPVHVAEALKQRFLELGHGQQQVVPVATMRD
ncbi:MAG TPA: pantetheine-phosphate adenylyltransferase [Anaerolineaceae bacterium]|nr:pantetheine-phosphate adenylyltransferase [Anaerolineaceae bacterium]